MNITILEDTTADRERLERAVRKGLTELNVTARLLTIGSIAEFEEALKGDGSHHLYFLPLDIEGKENKGFETAQLIRSCNPHAIIVLMTKLSEIPPLAFKYQIAALDFIGKDAEDYDKRVKDCLIYTIGQLRIIGKKEGRRLF